MAESQTSSTQATLRHETRGAILIAASRLLAYPDHALRALLPDIAAYLVDLPVGDSANITDAAPRLVRVAERLREADSAELEARYVVTFDLQEPTSLYLTAHELGDSRRRGQALAELRAMLRVAGFEESGDELPDFLPLLLEFLAHAPADMPADAVTALEQRIAAVCERIQGHLDADNLYYDVFGALRDVFPSSVEADPDKRFSGREQADTGEMPYPLHYD